MNKQITKENIYNRAYKQIIINHSKAYKKYNELKYEEDDNKRGIALYKSNSLKKAVERIKNDFKTTYELTGLDEIQFAINILNQFVKEPIIILQSLSSTNTIGNLTKIKTPCNDPRINNENSLSSSHYKIVEQIQTYLNSACIMESIFIENSFQLSLALLKKDFNPTMSNEEINSYVNTTCDKLVEKYNLSIEFPIYSLGKLENYTVKIKTIFCGYTLYEVNKKSKKIMPYETEEFHNILEDVLKVAFPCSKSIIKNFPLSL